MSNGAPVKAFMMVGNEWPLVEVLTTYPAPNDGNLEATIRYMDGPAKGVESCCGQCVLLWEHQVRGLVRRLDRDRPAVEYL